MNYLAEIVSYASSGYPLVFLFSDDHLELQTELRTVLAANTNNYMARVTAITLADGAQILMESDHVQIESESADDNYDVDPERFESYEATVNFLRNYVKRSVRGKEGKITLDITLLHDHETMLDSPGFSSSLVSWYLELKDHNKKRRDEKSLKLFLVLVSSSTVLSDKLSNISMSLRHKPPERAKIVKTIAKFLQGTEIKDGKEVQEALADRLVGLTMSNIKKFLAVQVTEAQASGVKTIANLRSAWQFRTEILNREGLIKVLDTENSLGFDGIGGMDGLKEYSVRCLRSRSKEVKPRGVLLISHPGMGKTEYVTALAGETSNPAVSVNFSSLMGSLVGQTESATSRTLDILEAMAPDKHSDSYLIVMLDELDRDLVQKGFDSTGVATRQLSIVIKWLSSHTANIFVIGTSNNPQKMDPALTRAGRFDNLFYIEDYTPEQQIEVWKISIKKTKLDPAKHRIRWYITTKPGYGIVVGKAEETSDFGRVTIYESLAEANNALEYVRKEKGGAYLAIDVGANTSKWSGAEIFKCCCQANLLDITLEEAASRVISVKQMHSDDADALVQAVDGKCLSASTGKIYTSRKKPDGRPRKNRRETEE